MTDFANVRSEDDGPQEDGRGAAGDDAGPVLDGVPWIRALPDEILADLCWAELAVPAPALRTELDRLQRSLDAVIAPYRPPGAVPADARGRELCASLTPASLRRADVARLDALARRFGVVLVAYRVPARS